MLVITNDAIDQLGKAYNHASKLDPDILHRLMRDIISLDSWFGEHCYCELYTDFAPYSFVWSCYDSAEKNKLLLHGGLIFHGDDFGWSLHT